MALEKKQTKDAVAEKVKALHLAEIPFPTKVVDSGIESIGKMKLQALKDTPVFSQGEKDAAKQKERAGPEGFSMGIHGQEEFAKLASPEELEESLQEAKKSKAKDMIVHVLFPYNAEPPKSIIAIHDLTPNEYHYVRNHGNIPLIKEEEYRLEFTGLIDAPRVFTLQELKASFPIVEEVVTLQCAGNRRSGMARYYPLEGDEVMTTMWSEQAISTALYKGIRLSSLLEVLKPSADVTDVELIGHDMVIKHKQPFHYGANVSMKKVLAGEVLLVWEMNGAPLPPIHGYPLRALTLGWSGCRSCKWLSRINFRSDPSPIPTVQQEYRWFPKNIGEHNVNWQKGMMLIVWPVNSCIMSPLQGHTVKHRGKIGLAGWAWSGVAPIERVEVSVNGGATWHVTETLSPKRPYAWRIWRAVVPCLEEGPVYLACRAFDSSTASQPSDVSSCWNWRGYNNNAIHQVAIYSILLADETKEKEKENEKEEADSRMQKLALMPEHPEHHGTSKDTPPSA